MESPILISHSLSISSKHRFWLSGYLDIQSAMPKRIRFLFIAQQKDGTVEAPKDLSYRLLLDLIMGQIRKYQNPQKPQLKAFIRKQVKDHKHPKYIKLQKQVEVVQHMRSMQNEEVIVEFFHGRKDETIKQTIIKIGKILDQREKELKNITNQLKDQVNQLNALKMIRKSTSPSQEEIIEVFLVVCDPLVQYEKELDSNEVRYPLYHEEIDLPSHLERLRKASLSNGDFKIKVKRAWGTKSELNQCLKHGTEGDRDRRIFGVVQIFTRVELKNGTLMMSLEGEGKQLGLRVWLAAEQFFKGQIYANILIIVGVGVNQLSELAQRLNFNRPLILISTISLEDKRIITTTCDRSLIDIQNTYNDKYCQVFLQSFYSNLFRRYELRKCYQMAMKDLSQPSIKQNLWCCCLHAHHQSCNWPKIARRIGQLQLHRLLKHQHFLNIRKNPQRKKLQSLLLYNNYLSPCTDEKLCCWERVSGVSYREFHQSLDKSIIWNQRESDQVYSKLEPQQEMPNRFESETYEKPTGRRRPLTIYRVVQHILKNDICILRAPIISQAKRYFSFAREYLQVRNPCLFFYEFESSSLRESINFRKKAEELIQQKSNARLGASLRSRRKQWIFLMQYSHDNSQRYYQGILKDFLDLTSYYTREVKMKLVLLTDDQQFMAVKIINMLTDTVKKNQKKVQNLTIEDPFDVEETDTLQLFHTILTRHSSDYVNDHFEQIIQQIREGDSIDQEREENELRELFKDEDAYLFLGFLSQFSEDGFYLNKVSLIILTQLFGSEVMENALNNKLPVEHINLADSVYLQLQKVYHNHFKSSKNEKKISFQEKKLQFYYLLMRIYFQFWPKVDVVNYPEVIRQLINKEGIFSIDIELERTEYEASVEACLREIEPIKEQIKSLLFDVSNSIHIYHLGQVEKILQEFLKKKRNKHNATTANSRSAIDLVILKRFQYLVWSIVMKSWLMSQVLYKHYEEYVKRFQMVLIIFFVQVQIPLPVSEVARIQMHVLMNKFPPKLQECDFGKLSTFLRFYRTYALKTMSLVNLQPGWGNHHKCKDLIGNCFYLSGKIGEIIDLQKKTENFSQQQLKQYNDFKDLIQFRHPMFKHTNRQQWERECLKLIEKKVIYYFSFTSIMKQNQSAEDYQEKMVAFQKQFKLGEIVYELEKYKSTLPVSMLQEPETMLIDQYIKVKLSEMEVDKTVLTEFKGKISSQYLPIFSYLIQKVEQKELFNQKGLIIFSRARNLVCDGQPYFYTRKRTLLTEYLGKVFHDRELKISYFPLTEKTLDIFQLQKCNSKCEVLCMILTIDAYTSEELMFGSQSGVDTVKMSIYKFAQKIKRCRIRILILCGKNSTKICENLRQIMTSPQNIPIQYPMTHSLNPSADHKMALSAIRVPTSAIRSNNNIKNSHSSIKESSSSSNTSRLKATGVSSSSLRSKSTSFPTIIAIESSMFSLNDTELNIYHCQNSKSEAQKQSGGQQRKTSPRKTERMSVRKSQKQLNRRSLLRNSKISVTKKAHEQEKQEVTPGQDNPINIDEIIREGVERELEHERQLQMADSSGRNIFPIIFEEANSEVSQECTLKEQQKWSPVQSYLANQVNHLGMDLMLVSFIKKIVKKVSVRDTYFMEPILEEMMHQSKEQIKHILSSRFECAEAVFSYINYSIWVNNPLIPKVPKGTYEDLTKKFHCAENNLHDENYYQNIGHCLQLNTIFDSLIKKKAQCIQIYGGFRGQKANLLQEICWYAQIKSLFKFGIIKIDLKDGTLDDLRNRTYKYKESHIKSQSNPTQMGLKQTGILIAIDNIDDNIKKHAKQLEKLKGKLFTVIYNANRKESGEELRQILGFSDCMTIDLNRRSPQEENNFIYATLLSHIKENQELELTKQVLEAYQKKIDEIMKSIEKIEVQDKLAKALELLRGSKSRTDNKSTDAFCNFYKRHFQQLLGSLEQIKEITIRIV